MSIAEGLGVVKKVIDTAAGIKDVIGKGVEEESMLTCSYDIGSHSLCITNNGKIDTYNVTVSFEDTDWTNPFEGKVFQLAAGDPPHKENLYVMDLNRSRSAIVVIKWTDALGNDKENRRTIYDN